MSTATTTRRALRPLRPPAKRHGLIPRHKPHTRHFFGSVGHGISNAARGVDRSVDHAFNFVHHHAAASVGVAALIAIVVVATVARTLVRDRMLRLAHWMGVPRVGPPPPGPMD